MRQPSFSASEMCGSVSVVACDLAGQQRLEAEVGPGRRAAQLHHVARHEALEQMQRDIVGAEVERHADRNVGELLRRVDGGFGTDDDRRIGDDGAAADLPASLAGLLDAAVVAPLARIVHVGLAVLEHLAVAQEGVEPFGRDDVGRNAFRVGALVAVRPLDLKPLLFEQAFVIGDEFRQALERLGVFQRELLHGGISGNLRGVAALAT